MLTLVPNISIADLTLLLLIKEIVKSETETLSALIEKAMLFKTALLPIKLICLLIVIVFTPSPVKLPSKVKSEDVTLSLKIPVLSK